MMEIEPATRSLTDYGQTLLAVNKCCLGVTNTKVYSREGPMRFGETGKLFVSRELEMPHINPPHHR